MKKILRFSKKIYIKECILKSAYFFSEKYFFYIDEDNNDYIVKIEAKDDKNDECIDKEFINEIVSQMVRYNIMIQTKNIRELILGRALATTMINDCSKFENDENNATNTDLNNILIDWFDKYDIR